MLSRFFLGLSLFLTWGSQALADFNDSIVIAVSPKFPSDTSLELTAENLNDDAAYCSLRVDASYILASSPETKRHLLIKTQFFVASSATLSGFEFGRDEFMELGIPGSAYIDTNIVVKNCQPASDVRFFEFNDEGDSVEMILSFPNIRTYSGKSLNLKRRCQGVIDDASMLQLLKTLHSPTAQGLKTSYGGTTSSLHFTTLEWKDAKQMDRSVQAHWNLAEAVPSEVEAFLSSIKKFRKLATDCGDGRGVKF